MWQQICDLHEREVIDCETAVEVVDHIVVEDSDHSWVEDGNQMAFEDEGHIEVEDDHSGEGGAIGLGEVEGWRSETAERLKFDTSWTALMSRRHCLQCAI